MTDVHVVVPEGIDDQRRPSGGNVYDRRVIDELTEHGWSVYEHAVPGSWPAPGDHAALDKIVSDLPDGAVVLVDGLVASAAPEVLVPHAGRLHLVVLVHMPLGEAAADDVAVTRDREQGVLTAAAAVVTTSTWTRTRLLDRYTLPADRVHVAEPGVDPGALAPGTASGGELLCVAAVAPHKGHDVLLNALEVVREQEWRCTLVGSLDRDPEYVDRLRDQLRRAELDGRVRFTGPLTRAALDDAYARADVLVLPSRGETYGMVVTEALAHGLPVIGTAVGGLPATLESAGQTPGMLVPPDNPEAIAEALDRWLTDGEVRRALRRAAERRRATLRGWSVTGDRIARVLTGLA